jgi:hypothetical protein
MGLVAPATARTTFVSEFESSACFNSNENYQKVVMTPISATMNGRDLKITARDGRWVREESELVKSSALDFASLVERSNTDGWAVFAADINDDGRLAGFKVHYMFGDRTDEYLPCAVIPRQGKTIKIFDMPESVVNTFAVQHLTRSSINATRNAQNLRGIILAGLKYYDPTAKAVTPAPVSQPEPQVTQVASPVATGQLSAEREMEIAEKAHISFQGMPEAVANDIKKWISYCKESNWTQQFSSDFITYVDIDGDGDKDWVLNGDEMSCVDERGDHSASGGGSGGASLDLFVTVRGDVVPLNLFVQSATIHQFTGYAALEIADNKGRNLFRMRDGKLTKLRSLPQGGKVVYNLGR